MSTTSVFATTSSTIHADLTVVALKRVGISTGCISMLYPSTLRPDSVLYWIEGAMELLLSSAGESVTVSGPLRFALSQHEERAEFPSLLGGLRSLGLSEEQGGSFVSSLHENRVVLCIDAADEDELAVIFHILHNIGAEKIVLTESAAVPSPLHRVSSLGLRRREKAGLALSAA